MIISKLTGGLGNQMFQYAAGLAVAKLRRTVLKLDVSWYRYREEQENHDAYALSCFNITEQFATAQEISDLLKPPAGVARRIYRTLRGRKPVQRRHAAVKFTFYPEFHAVPDPIYLEGNWQSEQFFAPAALMLRRHFTFRYPLPASARPLARQIQEDPGSVAIHFRRGDYVAGKLNLYCRALDLGYYQRAVETIESKVSNPSLYIFSDDIEQIAREFKTLHRHTFVRPAVDWQPFDELNLMSMCRHNIIANSTFSWWAGWLNPSPDKVVIGPTPWFADSTYDGSDVLPINWIKLPAGHARAAQPEASLLGQ